jgi:hypothetical protein
MKLVRNMIRMLVLVVLLAFLASVSASAELTPQEWWTEKAELVARTPGLALYWIQKQSSEESSDGKPDLVFAWRSMDRLSYLIVDDGPWPKASYEARAVFDPESGLCIGLGYWSGSWNMGASGPDLRPTRLAPPPARPIYARRWIQRFISSGPQGFDYGLFEGSYGEWLTAVVRPMVEKYSGRELKL